MLRARKAEATCTANQWASPTAVHAALFLGIVGRHLLTRSGGR